MGWLSKANSRSCSCFTTQYKTPAISSALSTALTSSATLCQENIFPRPLIGSIRLKSSWNALGDITPPPIMKGVAMAAAMARRKIGPAMTKASAVNESAEPVIKAVSKAASRLKLKPCRRRLDDRCVSQPPRTQKALAPAASTMKAISSRDCGTLPSSRACSRRRDDAGSVRSRSLSSATEVLAHTGNYCRRHPRRTREQALKRPLFMSPRNEETVS